LVDVNPITYIVTS